MHNTRFSWIEIKMNCIASKKKVKVKIVVVKFLNVYIMFELRGGTLV